MGLDPPIAGRVGEKHFFFRIDAILFGSSRASPTRIRGFTGLRAPKPHGSDLVGATRPHTPGFTFGRPKVNRKTAKTKVLDSFFQSVFINGETSLPLNFVLFLIYSLVVNDASAAAL